MNDIDETNEDDVETDNVVNERRMQELYLNLQNIGYSNLSQLRLETRNAEFIETIEKLLLEVFDNLMNNVAGIEEIRLCNEYICNLIGESIR